jgi:hypothetical protein
LPPLVSALLLWALLLLSAGSAQADAARADLEETARGADDRAASDALYALAELDDQALDFASALSRYEASAKRAPSGRFAARAIRRAAELRSHSEGGFAPLAALERVRRSPALSNDEAAVDALLKSADGFPPGRVRVDAWMLGAEAYAGRLRRPADAPALYRKVADDPHAEVLTARAAATELLTGYVNAKDYTAALDVIARYPRLVPSSSKRDVVRLLRRSPLRALAWSDLGLLFAAGLVSLVRPDRRRALLAVKRLAPMALLFALVATVLGGTLASRYERSSPYPFTAMLPVIFLVALVARAWSSTGSPVPWARWLRAVVSFTGVFAAAFLMLDRMDPVYLGGFGL